MSDFEISYKSQSFLSGTGKWVFSPTNNLKTEYEKTGLSRYVLQLSRKQRAAICKKWESMLSPKSVVLAMPSMTLFGDFIYKSDTDISSDLNLIFMTGKQATNQASSNFLKI